ncbi:MAG: Hsp70 family protein, partial [Verrucomicrobiales bacterium]
ESSETRNQAESMAYQIKKSLEELGDKVPEDKKKTVEEAVAKVEEALKGDDTEAIKKTSDELQNVFNEVATAAYADAGGGAPGADPMAGFAGGAANAGAPGATGADEASGEPKEAKGKVVDADFEVVDEEKK